MEIACSTVIIPPVRSGVGVGVGAAGEFSGLPGIGAAGTSEDAALTAEPVSSICGRYFARS